MAAFRYVTALSIVLLVFADPALCQDFTEGMNDFDIATEAGDVVGGARACNYELDMAKVEIFIKTRIAAMAGDARDGFRTAVDIRDYSLREMPENERQAQCILQRELAEKYGFKK
jgi:hypothetical protein